MTPQHVITLGARTPNRTPENAVGIFSDTDYATIEKVVRKEHGFQGCTIIRACGFYQGQKEDTVQIIILASDSESVKKCARELLGTFRQRSVLYTCTGTGEFLTGKDEANEIARQKRKGRATLRKKAQLKRATAAIATNPK